MITATNLNPNAADTVSGMVMPGAPGEQGSAEGAADFLQELQAALAMPAKLPEGELSEAEDQALTSQESSELQNLPSVAVAAAMSPAIFAMPVSEVSSAGAQAVGQALAVQAAAAPSTVLTADLTGGVKGSDDPASVGTSAASAAAAGVTTTAPTAVDALLEGGEQALAPDALSEAVQGKLTSTLLQAQDAQVTEQAPLAMTQEVTEGSRFRVEAVPQNLTPALAETADSALLQRPQAEASLLVRDPDSGALAADQTAALDQDKEALPTAALSDLGTAGTSEPAGDESMVSNAINTSNKTATLSDAPDIALPNAGGVSSASTPSVVQMNAPVLESLHRLPVEPHQMRLDGGPVQTEVTKAATAWTCGWMRRAARI